MGDLQQVESRIAETNASIELQRQLIEKGGCKGYSATSAQIIFDSLCLSLSLYVRERQRLRQMANIKAA